MYKLFVNSFLMLLLLAAISNAQNRVTPADRAKHLQKELGLTGEQTVKVDSIFTAAFKKLRNVDARGIERRSKFREIMDEASDEIKSILTDEQKVKYEKLIEERRNRMQQRRSGMRGRMQ